MFVKIPKGRAYEAVMIGHQIRHLRRVKDMSQKTLAAKINVTPLKIGAGLNIFMGTGAPAAHEVLLAG